MDLNKLTKSKLLEKCNDLGITNYKSKNKNILIDLIINFKGQDIKNNINIDNSNFDELKYYYNNILNLDKTTYKSSNDEPTPIECIINMIDKLPIELWNNENLSILDPCCGNGNFALPILFKLVNENYTKKYILENILEFNDINIDRLLNVKKIYCNDNYNLNITNFNYLTHNYSKKYDLIMANPPYAKLLENGKRASKNHNLIKDFIEKSLQLLKPNGYLMFITPDNWMSYANRNTLIELLTELQIIHLDIHGAKKYFKKIGSSFTWYIIQNCKFYKNINISGLWRKKYYESNVISYKRKYIPLVLNNIVHSILQKTIDNITLKKFDIRTSSNLHKYTKSKFINENKTEIYKYKLIHTPKQIVYSSIPHIYQEGFKLFISITDNYKVFIDDCGMTQSIVFILCQDKSQAEKYLNILQHPLYIFLNNICRWGNFNNIKILQNFPIPEINYSGNYEEIYTYFNISNEEISFITNNS